MIENRPGAGAVIGLVALAKSTPDGYTLVLSGCTLAVAGTLYKKPPFDANKDFAPVALVAHYPFLLVASTSLPAKSVPELIKLAKQKPGKLLYASPGVATSQHLFAELLKVTDRHRPRSYSLQRHRAGGRRYRRRARFADVRGSGSLAPADQGREPAALGVIVGRAAGGGSRRPADRRRRARASTCRTGRSSWRPPARRREIVNKLHGELKAVMAMPDVAEAARQDRHDPDRQPLARGARIVRQLRGHALGQDRAAGRHRRSALEQILIRHDHNRQRRRSSGTLGR